MDFLVENPKRNPSRRYFAVAREVENRANLSEAGVQPEEHDFARIGPLKVTSAFTNVDFAARTKIPLAGR